VGADAEALRRLPPWMQKYIAWRETSWLQRRGPIGDFFQYFLDPVYRLAAFVVFVIFRRDPLAEERPGAPQLSEDPLATPTREMRGDWPVAQAPAPTPARQAPPNKRMARLKTLPWSEDGRLLLAELTVNHFLTLVETLSFQDRGDFVSQLADMTGADPADVDARVEAVLMPVAARLQALPWTETGLPLAALTADHLLTLLERLPLGGLDDFIARLKELTGEDAAVVSAHVEAVLMPGVARLQSLPWRGGRLRLLQLTAGHLLTLAETGPFQGRGEFYSELSAATGADRAAVEAYVEIMLGPLLRARGQTLDDVLSRAVRQGPAGGEERRPSAARPPAPAVAAAPITPQGGGASVGETARRPERPALSRKPAPAASSLFSALRENWPLALLGVVVGVGLFVAVRKYGPRARTAMPGAPSAPKSFVGTVLVLALYAGLAWGAGQWNEWAALLPAAAALFAALDALVIVIAYARGSSDAVVLEGYGRSPPRWLLPIFGNVRGELVYVNTRVASGLPAWARDYYLWRETSFLQRRFGAWGDAAMHLIEPFALLVFLSHRSLIASFHSMDHLRAAASSRWQDLRRWLSLRRRFTPVPLPEVLHANLSFAWGEHGEVVISHMWSEDRVPSGQALSRRLDDVLIPWIESRETQAALRALMNRPGGIPEVRVYYDARVDVPVHFTPAVIVVNQRVLHGDGTAMVSALNLWLARAKAAVAPAVVPAPLAPRPAVAAARVMNYRFPARIWDYLRTGVAVMETRYDETGFYDGLYGHYMKSWIIENSHAGFGPNRNLDSVAWGQSEEWKAAFGETKWLNFRNRKVVDGKVVVNFHDVVQASGDAYWDALREAINNVNEWEPGTPQYISADQNEIIKEMLTAVFLRRDRSKDVRIEEWIKQNSVARTGSTTGTVLFDQPAGEFVFRYGAQAAADLWDVVRMAINHANQWEGRPEFIRPDQIDRIKAVILYHENLHDEFQHREFADFFAPDLMGDIAYQKSLLPPDAAAAYVELTDLATRLEAVFGMGEFDRNHPFIQALEEIYGRSHNARSDAAMDLGLDLDPDPETHEREPAFDKRWYMEEFFTVLLQESLYFNNAHWVIQQIIEADGNHLDQAAGRPRGRLRGFEIPIMRAVEQAVQDARLAKRSADGYKALANFPPGGAFLHEPTNIAELRDRIFGIMALIVATTDSDQIHVILDRSWRSLIRRAVLRGLLPESGPEGHPDTHKRYDDHFGNAITVHNGTLREGKQQFERLMRYVPDETRSGAEQEADMSSHIRTVLTQMRARVRETENTLRGWRLPEAPTGPGAAQNRSVGRPILPSGTRYRVANEILNPFISYQRAAGWIWENSRDIERHMGEGVSSVVIQDDFERFDFLFRRLAMQLGNDPDFRPAGLEAIVARVYERAQRHYQGTLPPLEEITRPRPGLMSIVNDVLIRGLDFDNLWHRRIYIVYTTVFGPLWEGALFRLFPLAWAAGLFTDAATLSDIAAKLSTGAAGLDAVGLGVYLLVAILVFAALHVVERWAAGVLRGGWSQAWSEFRFVYVPNAARFAVPSLIVYFVLGVYLAVPVGPALAAAFLAGTLMQSRHDALFLAGGIPARAWAPVLDGLRAGIASAARVWPTPVFPPLSPGLRRAAPFAAVVSVALLVAFLTMAGIIDGPAVAAGGTMAMGPAAPWRPAEQRLASRLEMEPDVQAKIARGEIGSFAVMDVNLLSQHNNILSRAGMDVLLEVLESRVQALARSMGGVAYRYGGDEFVVALPSDLPDAVVDVWMSRMLEVVEDTRFAVVSVGEEPLDPRAVEALEGEKKDGRVIDTDGVGQMLVLPIGPSEEAGGVIAARIRRANETLARTAPEVPLVQRRAGTALDDIGNEVRASLSHGVVGFDEVLASPVAEQAYDTFVRLASAAKEASKDLYKRLIRDKLVRFFKGLLKADEAEGIGIIRDDPSAPKEDTEALLEYIAAMSTDDTPSTPAWAPEDTNVSYYPKEQEWRQSIDDVLRPVYDYLHPSDDAEPLDEALVLSLENDVKMLENAVVLQLEVGGYTDDRDLINEHVRDFEKNSIILDKRNSRRALKVINDTKEYGYHAGNQMIALVQALAIAEAQFPEYDVEVVRGPPAGPFLLLVPREDRQPLSYADLETRFEAFGGAVLQGIARRSIIRAENILVAWTYLNPRRDDRIGPAMGRLSDLRLLHEHTELSGPVTVLNDHRATDRDLREVRRAQAKESAAAINRFRELPLTRNRMEFFAPLFGVLPAGARADVQDILAEATIDFRDGPRAPGDDALIGVRIVDGVPVFDIDRRVMRLSGHSRDVLLHLGMLQALLKARPDLEARLLEESGTLSGFFRAYLDRTVAPHQFAAVFADFDRPSIARDITLGDLRAALGSFHTLYGYFYASVEKVEPLPAALFPDKRTLYAAWRAFFEGPTLEHAVGLAIDAMENYQGGLFANERPADLLANPDMWQLIYRSVMGEFKGYADLIVDRGDELTPEYQESLLQSALIALALHNLKEEWVEGRLDAARFETLVPAHRGKNRFEGTPRELHPSIDSALLEEILEAADRAEESRPEPLSPEAARLRGIFFRPLPWVWTSAAAVAVAFAGLMTAPAREAVGVTPGATFAADALASALGVGADAANLAAGVVFVVLLAAAVVVFRRARPLRRTFDFFARPPAPAFRTAARPLAAGAFALWLLHLAVAPTAAVAPVSPPSTGSADVRAADVVRAPAVVRQAAPAPMADPDATFLARYDPLIARALVDLREVHPDLYAFAKQIGLRIEFDPLTGDIVTFEGAFGPDDERMGVLSGDSLIYISERYHNEASSSEVSLVLVHEITHAMENSIYYRWGKVGQIILDSRLIVWGGNDASEKRASARALETRRLKHPHVPEGKIAYSFNSHVRNYVRQGQSFYYWVLLTINIGFFVLVGLTPAGIIKGYPAWRRWRAAQVAPMKIGLLDLREPEDSPLRERTLSYPAGGRTTVGMVLGNLDPAAVRLWKENKVQVMIMSAGGREILQPVDGINRRLKPGESIAYRELASAASAKRQSPRRTSARQSSRTSRPSGSWVDHPFWSHVVAWGLETVAALKGGELLAQAAAGAVLPSEGAPIVFAVISLIIMAWATAAVTTALFLLPHFRLSIGNWVIWKGNPDALQDRGVQIFTVQLAVGGFFLGLITLSPAFLGDAMALPAWMGTAVILVLVALHFELNWRGTWSRVWDDLAIMLNLRNVQPPAPAVYRVFELRREEGQPDRLLQYDRVSPMTQGIGAADFLRMYLPRVPDPWGETAVYVRRGVTGDFKKIRRGETILPDDTVYVGPADTPLPLGMIGAPAYARPARAETPMPELLMNRGLAPPADADAFVWGNPAGSDARLAALQESIGFRSLSWSRERPTRRFDFIYIPTTGEEGPNPAEVRARLARALRPGGVAVIRQDQWSPGLADALRPHGRLEFSNEFVMFQKNEARPSRFERLGPALREALRFGAPQASSVAVLTLVGAAAVSPFPEIAVGVTAVFATVLLWAMFGQRRPVPAAGPSMPAAAPTEAPVAEPIPPLETDALEKQFGRPAQELNWILTGEGDRPADINGDASPTLHEMADLVLRGLGQTTATQTTGWIARLLLALRQTLSRPLSATEDPDAFRAAALTTAWLGGAVMRLAPGLENLVRGVHLPDLLAAVPEEMDAAVAEDMEKLIGVARSSQILRAEELDDSLRGTLATPSITYYVVQEPGDGALQDALAAAKARAEQADRKDHVVILVGERVLADPNERAVYRQLAELDDEGGTAEKSSSLVHVLTFAQAGALGAIGRDDGDRVAAVDLRKLVTWEKNPRPEVVRVIIQPAASLIEFKTSGFENADKIDVDLLIRLLPGIYAAPQTDILGGAIRILQVLHSMA